MPRTVVIIGAGQAGGNVAHALRAQGFDGRIVLIGDETHPPYERPPLSKAVLCGAKQPEDTYLWPQEKYREHAIELRLETRAARIRPGQRVVECSGGEQLAYDALVVATGAKVRRLDVPGAALKGVHYLRTIEDSLAIRGDIAVGAPVLIVGGGWIGLEAAASLTQLGARVVVVEGQSQLCGRSLPSECADYLQSLHKSHGVEIRLNESVRSFSGAARVESATLSNGEVLPIAAAIIGIGVVPNDELAREAGLSVDNGIVVDEFGRTSNAAIYAAGDVTNQPNAFLGARVRLESWANAQNQAIAVAKSIAGKDEAYAEVPWFWSDQYDINLQIVGAYQRGATTIWRGDRNGKKCLAVFLLGEAIQGAAAFNNARELRIIRKLIETRRAVSAALLADTSRPLQDLLK